MNTYYVSKQFTKQLGKLAFVALSSICLFNTAFTTPALAEAQKSLDTFAQDSLQNVVEVSTTNTKDILHTVSQDASTLFAVADPDLPIDSADVPASSDSVSSASEATNADAIVIEGDTVVIQGDTNTSAIRTVMQSDAGKATNTVLFKNQIAITTNQTGSSNAPFSAATWLKYVTAAEGARVSFVAGGSASAPTLAYFFYSCSSLESLDGLSAWDVSNVSGEYCMSSMFYSCSSLTSLDGLSAWNVSGVDGQYCMQSMFNGCSSLASLDGLSAWDVSGVSGPYCMSGMFLGCTSLTSLDGLSAWDVSSVSGQECMEYMFRSCTSLTSLDGLSAWNVSNVSGEYCMAEMFVGCSALTSLDGLSAWNVSGVNGEGCMYAMFNACTSLFSIDALSSWDIQTALNFKNGVMYMFSRNDNTAVSSLTTSSTFTLSKDMFLRQGDYSLPSVSWWPVDATTPSAVAMKDLATKSQDTANYGYRWQQCTTGTDNPMKAITNLSVVWPLTANLTYTGLLQTVTPTVTTDGAAVPAGTELKAGSDFYVTYTNNTSGKVTDAIKDAGTYTARVIPRGAYTYTGEAETASVTIDKLDLSRETNPVTVYTVPSVCTYTGSALTPKTMVKLYLRDDPNPTSTEQDPKPDIPIYTYLVQNTTKRDEGDYSVSYNDNIGPGTATATVSPAIPTGLSASNLQGSASGTFRILGDYIVTFDSNGGSKVDSIEAINNQTIQEPTAPTKQGFFFAGWYKDNAFKTKWDFDKDIVTSDITLYAKWEQAPGPIPPGPTPGPTPSADTDTNLIPLTGDTHSEYANFAAFISLSVLSASLFSAAYVLKRYAHI